MAEKKELIYGGYRNEAFYRNFYKDKSAAQAYADTAEYLKKPTFNHEKDCALKVYMEVYKIKFQSSEQHQIESQANEIARLRAELEAKAELPMTPYPLNENAGISTQSPSDVAVTAIADFPKGMNKEAFKEFYTSQYEKVKHVKPHWQIWSKAWKEYQDKQTNEIPA